MKRKPFHFAYLAFSVSASLNTAVHAQSCSVSLSYSPVNPIVGQALTVNYVVKTPSPAANSGFVYQLYVNTVQPGPPSIENQDNEIQVSIDDPRASQFPLTPQLPGPLLVQIGAVAVPASAFGLVPICGPTLPNSSITIPIAPATPSALPNAIHGQYAFLFQGTLPQLKGASQSVAAAGSFTADGQGNITSGMEDINSSLGAQTKVPVTGSYSIDPTGHGTLKLHSSLGVQSFKFFVQPTQLTSTLTSATLFSDDGYAVFGSGTLARQSAGSGPFGQAVVHLTGDLPCSSTCVSGPPVYETGLLSFLYGTVTGDLAVSGGSVLLPEQTISGTWEGADQPTGRFTYSISQGTYPAIHLAGYMVDSNHFFTVSTDSHASTYLLSGTGSE